MVGILTLLVEQRRRIPQSITGYSVRSIELPATRDAPYTLFCDGGGATNRTTCSSRSGLNGFAMHTTAPSWWLAE
jgi:hypothetical protein